MTLRHFKIFISVSEHLNMTKASKELYISQSAVSQAIHDLEDHYHVKLFERLSRKLSLTAPGEILLGYARHITRLHIDAASAMQAIRHNGPIRLGASVTVATSLLPPLIANFKRVAETFDIEVVEDNTAIIEKMILQDTIDIGIVEGDLTSKELSVTALLKDDLVFICSKQHPFANQRDISLDALTQENFILREIGSGTRKKFEDVMHNHQLSWQSNWTCNNADTIKMAVEHNLGLSVISQRSVIREVSEGHLYAFSLPSLNFNRTFKLIHHRHKYLSDSMTRFISFCQDISAYT